MQIRWRRDSKCASHSNPSENEFGFYLKFFDKNKKKNRKTERNVIKGWEKRIIIKRERKAKLKASKKSIKYSDKIKN